MSRFHDAPRILPAEWLRLLIDDVRVEFQDALDTQGVATAEDADQLAAAVAADAAGAAGLPIESWDYDALRGALCDEAGRAFPGDESAYDPATADA